MDDGNQVGGETGEGRFDHLPKESFGGFWRRAVAFLLDCAFVSIFTMVAVLTINTLADRLVVPVVQPPVHIDLKLKREISRTQETFNGHDGEMIEEVEKSLIWFVFPAYSYIKTFEYENNGVNVNLVVARSIYDPENDQIIRDPILTTNTLFYILLAVYLVGLEASGPRATLGKRIFGLQIRDVHGRPLSAGKVVARNLYRVISILTLFAGMIMIVFDSKRRSMHDRFVSSLVLKKQALDQSSVRTAETSD